MIPSMLFMNSPSQINRIRASPDTENPDMDKPDTEKPAELNIEKSNTEKTKYLWIKYRFHSLPGLRRQDCRRNGKEGMRCLSQR